MFLRHEILRHGLGNEIPIVVCYVATLAHPSPCASLGCGLTLCLANDACFTPCRFFFVSFSVTALPAPANAPHRSPKVHVSDARSPLRVGGAMRRRAEPAIVLGFPHLAGGTVVLVLPQGGHGSVIWGNECLPCRRTRMQAGEK